MGEPAIKKKKNQKKPEKLNLTFEREEIEESLIPLLQNVSCYLLALWVLIFFFFKFQYYFGSTVNVRSFKGPHLTVSLLLFSW